VQDTTPGAPATPASPATTTTSCFTPPRHNPHSHTHTHTHTHTHNHAHTHVPATRRHTLTNTHLHSLNAGASVTMPSSPISFMYMLKSTRLAALLCSSRASGAAAALLRLLLPMSRSFRGASRACGVGVCQGRERGRVEREWSGRAVLQTQTCVVQGVRSVSKHHATHSHERRAHAPAVQSRVPQRPRPPSHCHAATALSGSCWLPAPLREPWRPQHLLVCDVCDVCDVWRQQHATSIDAHDHSLSARG
jgi:hypothetical protein